MANTYIALIRGIDVGGKNAVTMTTLRACLQERGYPKVSTYIASGNVILESEKSPDEIKADIQTALLEICTFENELSNILVLSRNQFEGIVDNKPEGFGEQQEKYQSDVIFLIDVDSTQAMHLFDPREGIDQVWAGGGVIYSQRLGSQRLKSGLTKIVCAPIYQSMTIRDWKTTITLCEALGNMDADRGVTSLHEDNAHQP